MATYTVSAFSVDQRFPVKMGNAPFQLASGTITINPYSQTHLAVTKITGLFRSGGLIRVMLQAMDASGKYIVFWKVADQAVVAYTASATEASEGASDVGAIAWMAFGQVG